MRNPFQCDLENISYDDLIQKGKSQLIDNVLDENGYAQGSHYKNTKWTQLIIVL